jgi:hypothetical protein
MNPGLLYSSVLFKGRPELLLISSPRSCAEAAQDLISLRIHSSRNVKSEQKHALRVF